MASPVPTPNPDVQVDILSQMPSPCGKNSLCFCGKDIEDFLTEYEHFAEHMNLTSRKKCEEIRSYFAKKEKHVLDVLKGYLSGDWQVLKHQLKSLYMSS